MTISLREVVTRTFHAREQIPYLLSSDINPLTPEVNVQPSILERECAIVEEALSVLGEEPINLRTLCRVELVPSRCRLCHQRTLLTLSVTRDNFNDFDLVDGYCLYCTEDILPSLYRLEPVRRSPDLTGFLPSYKRNALCIECGELALVGIWRGQTCHVGECVNCLSLVMPYWLSSRYHAELANFTRAKWLLERKLRQLTQLMRLEQLHASVAPKKT